MQLIEKSETDLQIARIAAGPLEDWLATRWRDIGNLLEEPTRQSKKMREALSCVWLMENTPEGKILKDLKVKYSIP